MQAELEERLLSGLWLNRSKTKTTCDEWQAEYSAAVPGGSAGTVANLERVRPDGCQIPDVNA